MYRFPDDHPAWLDIMDPDRAPAPLAGDPYFPENPPMAPIDLSEEEDPLEDEGEYDPEEVAETDEEGILEDAQMDDDDPEESLTDEEITTPLSSPPRPSYQPHQSRGKCPLLMRTARKSVVPMSRLDTFSFVSRPSCGQMRKPSHEPAWLTDALAQRRTSDVPPRFEIGESSQAPPHDYPTPQDGRLADRVRSMEGLLKATSATSRAIEQRVERLEIEEKDDTEAIQTLYHRIGASRTEANTMSAQIRALEYRTQIVDVT